MSKASARRATSVPMAPSPTMPSARPSSPPSWAVFHGSGGSVTHDLGEVLLEGQHGGEHELGDGRRTRAPSSR